MTNKVTDLAAYKESKEDQYRDDLEKAERHIQLSAIRASDHLIDVLAEDYGVSPAFVAEAILLGLMGRASHAIRNTDDRAFADFLNYCGEASQDVLTELDIARGRDDAVRLQWRNQLYAHRFDDDDQ